MTENKPEALSALKTLADLLGVDLKDMATAIATPQQSATARMYDRSLEAELVSSSRRTAYVSSPRAPSIRITLVDPQLDSLAPEGAIYEISTFMPPTDSRPGGTMLNGDVFCVYVGRNGIILDDPVLRRAAELFAK